MNVSKIIGWISLAILGLLPALLFAQPDTIDRPAFVSENYQRFGLQPGNVPELWEDGARTDGAPGTYEWWYFDALLQDGSAVVCIFYTKDFFLENSPKTPTIALNISRPDGSFISRRVEFPINQTNFSTDSCNVEMGPNYFRGNLQNYVIHFEEPGLSFTANLTRSSAQSWRPKTGHVVFGDNQADFFGWLVAVPNGIVQVELDNNGTVENLVGSGYHDHNWSNAGMQEVFNHWYWVRSNVGPYTVITSEMVASKTFDKEKVNVVHLAKNGQLVADDGESITLYRTYGDLDPEFGKDVSDELFFLYEDEATGYRYEYFLKKQATIFAGDLLSTAIPDPFLQWLYALFTDLDEAAYFRFLGSAKLRILKDGQLLEEYENPFSLWELMHLNKVQQP
ncbi:MAG: hypothetical protein ACRBFS_13295 [Aureispira sp.]